MDLSCSWLPPVSTQRWHFLNLWDLHPWLHMTSGRTRERTDQDAVTRTTPGLMLLSTEVTFTHEETEGDAVTGEACWSVWRPHTHTHTRPDTWSTPTDSLPCWRSAPFKMFLELPPGPDCAGEHLWHVLSPASWRIRWCVVPGKEQESSADVSWLETQICPKHMRVKPQNRTTVKSRDDRRKASSNRLSGEQKCLQ